MQVTELRCGAMVVGCKFDHRAADAYSFFMFMSAWADIARNKPINQIPSYCRFLLSSQIVSPSNSSDPTFDRIFTPLSFLPPVNPKTSSEIVSRIYYISAVDIARLQELSGHSHSKLVCFIAYFWKILARSACRGEKSCSMGAVVNGRSFMKTVHGDNALKNYFGNVLSVPFGNLQVKTLLDMKLVEVADEVNKWLSPTTTEDHFLGLHDWVEARRPESMIATIFASEDSKEEDKSVSCVVSSGRWFPEIDFGWGNAAFWSCHFPKREKGGFLMPIPRPTTGDWVLYTQVAPSIVAAMEQEPTIFRPLRNLAVYKSSSSRARL
ncbi:HXXXD-type acyl-transferase family protein [Rhynchospora pubera]|uniref:HXXXD-type acyl-transferase family protein n=1 Tax=Rhynchospora pubera TaxID=906938 RepID=A0AAV8HEI6_9POAL|nr:HXXXD-type acyl-transferase family protein [Rhynchospora pubera]